MHRHLPRVVVCSMAVGMFLLAAPAAAQSSPAEQEADRLFKEANALVARGVYPEACSKLERSQELDPGVGTQFNLAHCYEMTDRPARAERLFREVERTARAAGKQERADSARQRAAALEPKVPELRLVLKEPVQGMVLTIDGEPFPKSDAAELSARVDPGSHELTASAPGKRPWKSTAMVAKRLVTVTVPPLEDEPLPMSAPAPSVTPTPDVVPAAAPPTWSTPRTLAIVAAGVGVVGLGVGTYFGLASKSDHDDAEAQCPNRGACRTEGGAEKWNDATSKGTISTMAFAVGGAALIGGAVLWFTAPKPHVAKTGVRVVPSFAGNHAGLVVTGGFQ